MSGDVPSWRFHAHACGDWGLLSLCISVTLELLIPPHPPLLSGPSQFPKYGLMQGYLLDASRQVAYIAKANLGRYIRSR